MSSSLRIGGSLSGGGGGLDAMNPRLSIIASTTVSSTSTQTSTTGTGVPSIFPQVPLNNMTRPLANNLTDFDRTVLNCTGVLPDGAYPLNLRRDYFRDLPELCSLGCSCVDNSTIPSCRTGNYSQTLFTSYPGVIGCSFDISSPTVQNSSCTCISPRAAAQANSGIDSVQSLQTSFVNGTKPFNVTAQYAQRSVAYQNRTAPCNQPLPANRSFLDFYNYYLAVQLSCLPPSLNIWTYPNPQTNSPEPFYRVCSPCLFGYGPDPDCVLQPVPLSGVCNDTNATYTVADTPNLGYKAVLFLKNLTQFGNIIVQNQSFFRANSDATSVPLYSLPTGLAAI